MGRPLRGRRLRLSLGPLLLAPPALLLAAFYAWPLAQVLADATPDAWAWIGTPYVRSRLSTAALQAALSAALALALALPLAWLHHARRIPWGRAQMALHAAPFVLPVFVVVYGLQRAVGPGGLLDDAVGLDLLGWLGPLGAVVIAHAYYNYGFAARVLRATLDRRPRRLEDAARALGAPPRDAFLRVTLPLLLPSILAVALLVFLFA
ncbi:MAG TPA: ABC transporter permease subunit, partial [Candidatus Thermoplasmatota archaeon]|nr:ABC transporter permease subunit [Candidatus Thermoplasmatota archaeon]